MSLDHWRVFVVLSNSENINTAFTVVAKL